MSRRTSVVINTYNRAESLRQTLESLLWLDRTECEVIVVNGPSTDHTDAIIDGFRGMVKVGRCPTRNLSRSRNIGLRLAAGEIVAFIDDDAVPDPGWLADLLPLFDDPEVAAVGGPVFDHTGTRLQTRYIICDRFGSAELHYDRDPSPALNIPLGERFCSTLGANSLFRRAAVAAVGGFDEEYEYYLDETDLCVRLVDAGWTVRYGERGFVYHRYLPSHVRNAARAVKDWYPVLKNKAYFAARHGAPLLGQSAAQRALDTFAERARLDTEHGIRQGHLPESALEAFDEAVVPATLHGLRRAAAVRVSSFTARRPGPDAAWRAFPCLAAASSETRLHLCYVSQDYPPGVVAGIARVTRELATGFGKRGYIVRVLTRAQDGLHRVDFEDGVWVHRLPDASDGERCCTAPELPANLRHRSLAVLRELERIEAMRPIDLVQAPNWDCEGLLPILGKRWRVVLGIYTPMTVAIEHNPKWAGDQAFLRNVGAPIIEGERLCYRQASAILACGPSIIRRIEDDYGVVLGDRPVGLVPHGLPDLGGAPPPSPDRDVVEILFVGRLEERKGIDVLLAAVPEVCRNLPEARFLVAGDHSLSTSCGDTWRERFLKDPTAARWQDRVAFLGVVDDVELDALYRRCDIVVVPSRFESFGLPLTEAMMRSRPVIAAAVGGMEEIVEAGGNGLLVPPGDDLALAAAIRRLVVSASDRRSFGERSRELFLERYTRDRMIEAAASFYRLIAELPEPHPREPAA